MWSVIIGNVLSIFFENQIIKFFKNKLITNTITPEGSFICWLFQEYQKNDLYISGGKRFMLESSYRYNFFTQSIDVITNFVIYPHLLISLELISFMTFISLITFIFNNNKKPNISKHDKIYNLPRILLCNIIFSSYVFGAIKIYSLSDVFFSFKPLLWLVITLFNMLFVIYIIHFYLLHSCPESSSLIMKILTKKILCCSIIFVITVSPLIYEFSTENLVTGNFFKEIFFKTILIYIC